MNYHIITSDISFVMDMSSLPVHLNDPMPKKDLSDQIHVYIFVKNDKKILRDNSSQKFCMKEKEKTNRYSEKEGLRDLNERKKKKDRD